MGGGDLQRRIQENFTGQSEVSIRKRARVKKKGGNGKSNFFHLEDLARTKSNRKRMSQKILGGSVKRGGGVAPFLWFFAASCNNGITRRKGGLGKVSVLRERGASFPPKKSLKEGKKKR